MKKKLLSLVMALTMLIFVCSFTASANTTYALGETWTFPGQWEFVINEIKPHNLCDSYWNEKYGFSNEQVVIIDFSFKNIGHNVEYSDLFFGGSNIEVYDEQGEAAEWYIGCDHTKNANACKVFGSKSSHATEAYALKNHSSSITIVVEEFYEIDGILSKASAVFNVPIGQKSTLQTLAPIQNNITVEIDGKQITFDVQPQIINGRTLVPLRAIFENLGATVNWNNDTQTVTSTKSSTNIQLTINNNIMYVNGIAKTLDVPATLIGGRTLVPVRAISEAFGYDVGWNGELQKVSIITQKEEINYQSFVDFVKEKGTYNQGKYGISTSIPRNTSDNGTTSWGSVSLLYDTSDNMLQLQILMDRESIKSGESNYFLLIDLKDNANQYDWEYQRTYVRSKGFWAAKGTVKANSKSYLSGDNVKLSKMIYGTEIVDNDMVTDVGMHLSLASAYMNNLFKDNDSSLNFSYFGIE